MRNVSSLEAIQRDYAPRGVKFYLIYKKLAHPGLDGYIDPFTLDERLTHIREAKRTLGTSIPWLCDNMSNDLKDKLGGVNNSEFVIDPAGKIVRMRDWSNAETLRKDLTELVGKVENPTRVASLNLNIDRSRQSYPMNVVIPLDRPKSLTRIKSVAQPSDQAFYAKLVASAEDVLLNEGDGRLVLSFQLDPVHRVHWNNLAAPLEFEITAHGDGEILPKSATSPHVEVDADVDPREFVIYFCGMDREQPLELTVRYFACSDSKGWCRPVTQHYKVHFVADREGRRGEFPFGGRRGQN